MALLCSTRTYEKKKTSKNDACAKLMEKGKKTCFE